MRCACGSEWWVERREIKPAAAPSLDPRVRTAARDYRIRLVCAECGVPAGSKPKQTKTPRRRATSG